ncbi:cobyric acid synthase [Paenibacillus sp. CAU 1782]
MLERYGHGGDLTTAREEFGLEPNAFVDFSSNMNPLGPPTAVSEVLLDYAKRISAYPDPAVRELVRKLALHHDIPEEALMVGNGAAELIDLAVRVLRPEKAAIAVPCFQEYGDALSKIGCELYEMPLQRSNGFRLTEDEVRKAISESGASLYVLGSPNNPTGALVEPRLIKMLLNSGASVLVDEAFMDFVPDEQSWSVFRHVVSHERLIVTRSMTKFYSIPGIRLGYAAASSSLIQAMRSLQVPWSVNSLAQEIGITMLSEKDFAAKTLEWLPSERGWLAEQLQGRGFDVCDSSANYLLLHLPPDSGFDAERLQRELGRLGVLIRNASRFSGLDSGSIRVAVKLRADNLRLLEALDACLLIKETSPLSDNNLASGSKLLTGNKRLVEHENNLLHSNNSTTDASSLPSDVKSAAKPQLGATLMVQGTASDVGKSIVTTALCRIFTQDGYVTKPFKSQNMSLNAYVTLDGKEIGVAQGMQADACGIAATTDMNPILLKPSGEMASQVVVHGKPLGNLKAKAYREQYLPIAGAIVRESLHRLRQSSHIVVMEGAGSPAEINLKDRDIVNMNMAAWGDAPVILVSDIDRGGVFASIIGTLELLEPEERDRVCGFIINKFRGEIALLKPGLDWLEEKTGKPVLGVLPYLPQLGLEAEDSLSLNEAKRGKGALPGSSRQRLDVAVIALPTLSNFSDFDPLDAEEDVFVRYVESVEEWGEPDAVLLPGCKNTFEALRWLRTQGLEEPLIRYMESGGSVVGICGGYEMLGVKLIDRLGVEDETSVMRGLDVFPFETVFASEKKTVRVEGRAVFGGNGESYPISGYEIHMGELTMLNDAALLHKPFRIRETLVKESDTEAATGFSLFKEEGLSSADGKVWGTFIHGIFHNDDFRRNWLNGLRRLRNWPELPSALQFRSKREEAFDRLAEHARNHLNLTLIYEIAGLKGRARS